MSSSLVSDKITITYIRKHTVGIYTYMEYYNWGEWSEPPTDELNDNLVTLCGVHVLCMHQQMYL